MNLGIIGFGNMAEAISQGFVKNNFLSKQSVFVYDIKDERREIAKSNFNFSTTSIDNLISKSDVILISVKPNQLEEILLHIKNSISKKLIISICAGKTISFIEKIIGNNSSISRVNPNTPALVGEGVTAITFNKNVDEIQKSFTLSLFKSVGKVYELEEKYLNAITGLAGSGPAFIFSVIEAMADAGVYSGLSRDMAYEIAAQTVLGSAKLVIETKLHPAKLRDNVASPGGTTIEGIYELEQKGFNGILMNSIIKAVQKADKLSV